MIKKITPFIILICLLLASCAPRQGISPTPQDGIPRVLASTSFLADIAQNVAGNRLIVEPLLPLGVDPHAYQPKPADAAKVAASTVLILNGADYEHFIGPLLENVGGERLIIEASSGLIPRASSAGNKNAAGDPHFWLDPNLVITYVENIRAGLTSADPEGAEIYKANAEAYIKQLQELDTWIKSQADTLTPEKRFLVTNHESLGYFADRYGFTILGTVIPSLSSEASPSAQEMAALADQIRASNAMVIFLDASDNPSLANQIAKEAKVKVISDLHLESLTPIGGPAPTYIDMMKYNTDLIVRGCKG
jgi:ABC-type Zn uptake system ZnuABC Zn-binding protein ZnuA